MLILADTDILLKLLEPTDPQHQAVRGAIRTLRNRGDEVITSPQRVRPVEYIWKAA